MDGLRSLSKGSNASSRPQATQAKFKAAAPARRIPWLIIASCKPWRKLMWCIGEITAEYRDRMNAWLDLYAQPYNPMNGWSAWMRRASNC